MQDGFQRVRRLRLPDREGNRVRILRLAKKIQNDQFIEVIEAGAEKHNEKRHDWH